MKEINRRNVIRGLAALPVMALAPGQDASSQRPMQHMRGSEEPFCPPNQLCVRFHGVWAFVFLPGRIVAVTPCVEEHSYWIGNGTQTQHLLRGKYHLDNVSGASSISPDEQAVRIQDIDVASTYLWMALPLPKVIKSFGESSISLDLKGTSTQPPKTSDSSKSNMLQLSTSHVLQYDTQGSNLVLNPSVNLAKDPKDGEFHIRAELLRGPGVVKDRNHLYRAVELLVGLFPKLDVKVIPNPITNTPANTDVCGAQFSAQPS